MKHDNKSFTTYAQSVVTGTEKQTSVTEKLLPKIVLKIFIIRVSAKSAQRRTGKNR